MKSFTVIAVLLLAAGTAFAQQPSSNEQALGQKLMTEINLGLSCGASLLTAQAKIKELEAQLAAAKPKEEEGKKK